ncbi:MAG: S8 family serine peptidase [Rhizobiaceae bacterium]
MSKLVEPDRIISALRSTPHARQRVIVEFAMPVAGEIQQAGQEPDIEARHAKISQAQDLILGRALAIDGGVAAAEAGDNFAIRRLKYSPMFAISADAALIDRLASDPSVVRIHEDRASRPLLSETVELIGGPPAQALGATGNGWAVAVLDTGARRSHKFLSGKVVSAACYSTHLPAQQILSTCAGNATSSTTIDSADDCTDANRRGCGHGTHISGVAAGSNGTPQAGEPVGGVAPGANIISIDVYTRRAVAGCDDLPAQYISGCLVSFESDQIAGLERVLELNQTHNIAAVLMSFGEGRENAECTSDPRRHIISDLAGQGIMPIAAAGNEGYGDSVNAPACIGNVVAVAASDKDNDLSPTSNWGALIDFVAPGVDVTSSHTIGSGSPGHLWSSRSGTSIAAAHVAGAVTALRSAVPGASNSAIFNALYSSGRGITHAGVTRPLIDVNEALAALGGPAAKAEMLTPAPGTQLPGSPVTFTWSAGNHVTNYVLSVGTTGPGSSNIFAGNTATTSLQATNLPTSGTVYVRLYSEIGGVYQHNDYTYTGGENRAVMISPVPNSVLPGTQVQFSWTEGIDAAEYVILISDQLGHGNNFYFSQTTTEQSVTATGLPTSGLLRVQLTTIFENGSSRSIDHEYTAGGLKAQITSPQVSEFFPLVPPDVEFQWSAGTGVLEYRLDVGTSGPGSTDVFSSSTGTSQSQLVEGIPYIGPIHVRLHSKFEAYWEYADYEYQTNGAISQITGPIPGSTLTATNVNFNWSLGTGVTEYRLLVGTQGPGSNDLFDENTGTERNRAVDVPNNGTIYVRVYSRIDGQWYLDDATYTAGGGKAAMVSPPPPSELRGSSINFIWSLGDGVDEYRLEIGDQGAGSSNIFSQSWIEQDRFHVYGLPDTGTLHVRLSSRFGEAWQHNDYVYTMNLTQAAQLISPIDGATLSVPQIYEWTSIAGATNYSLSFGSGPGRADYWSFSYAPADGTEHSINKPPNAWYDGRSLYVRLTTTSPAGIKWRDYIFETPDIETDPLAALISPVPGTTIVGSQALFSWTEAPSDTSFGPADEYDIRVGTGSPGQADIFGGSTGLGTSQLVTGLPTDGTTINVRLRTRFHNTWMFRDYTFTAAEPVLAEIVTPAPGSTIGGSIATFTWTQGVGISEYWLRVGTGPGGSDLFDGSMGTDTSATVSGLPDSGNIYVMLSSRVHDSWIDEDYVYQGGASEIAEIISPALGSTLGSSETFMWTPGAGVAEYRLRLGTTGIGSSDVFDEVLGLSTSRTVNGIPTGEAIHLRLSSRFMNGNWGHRDYVYGAAKAEMMLPAPGSILSETTVTFDWAAGSGVAGYWLYVGTNGAGSGNIFSAGGGQTSRQVSGLPTSGTVNVRLMSWIGSGWQFSDYTYTMDVAAKAEMTSPAPGSTLTSSSVTFDWNAGSGVAGYWLQVGSNGTGSANIFSGGGAQTSRTVSSLPASGTVNVRLMSWIGGGWQFNDYTYTMNVGLRAEMTSPAPGSTLTSSSATFAWTAGSGVAGYWLMVGTNGAGSANILSQGGPQTSRTVSGLPASGTLHVRLMSYIGSGWQFNDYSYVMDVPTKAAMISPAPGATLQNSTMTFQWTTTQGSPGYWLMVGTNGAGSANILSTGVSATQRSVGGLPRIGTINVRLMTYLAGGWQHNDYVYNMAVPAWITTPAPGSTLPGPGVMFQWAGHASIANYWLYVGTNGPGSSNIFNSGVTNSWRWVGGLPASGTVNVRLMTWVGGAWRFRDYTYTGGVGPAAASGQGGGEDGLAGFIHRIGLEQGDDSWRAR